MAVSASTDRMSAGVREQVDRAIALLESHPDAKVRYAARMLLEGIEAVQRAGLGHILEGIGTKDRHGPDSILHLVSPDTPGNAPQTVYRDALALAELPPGTMRAVDVRGVPLLIANVDGDVYAVRNRCGDGPLPLEFGTLDGAEIRCSWHGCRYDVRNGRGIDANGGRVQVYPVSIEDGRIRVALDAR